MGAVLVLLSAWPAAAQVRVGDFTSNMSGDVSVGYTADFGNQVSSDHSWTLGGDANLSGSFYKPNFLSYNAALYLNRSQANSDFQSISDASGVNLAVSLFGGSKFPGAVSYSKAYNSEGNFAVPGLANYVTHGNSDSLGISWSENLPDAPSFSAGFVMGNSQYSIYGTSEQGDNQFHSLNLHSGYSYAGFGMGAYYATGGGHSVVPQLTAAQAADQTHTGNSGYGFSVSHRLPWQGSVTSSLNRSEWSANYLNYRSTGAIDLFNTTAAMHPTNKLSLSANVDYSDNLSGQLYESILGIGGTIPGGNMNASSDSLDMMAAAGYSPGHNVQTSLYIERRCQSFEGQTYGDKTFGGSASYSHAFRNGYLNSSVNVNGNIADQTGQEVVGFSTMENYSTHLLGWQLNGTFNYSQNVQTLLVTYMNSVYSFSGNARRRWGKVIFNGGAAGSRTGLTAQSGTISESQDYHASLGYGGILSATGSYFKSNGQALETGGGLVPIPVPVPSDLISLYGGHGYSAALSGSPFKRLSVAAAYSNSDSSTSSNGSTSDNLSNQFNVYTQSQFRKLYFNSGYTRLYQSFSGSGAKPEIVSSFYVGISRWFNFF